VVGKRQAVYRDVYVSLNPFESVEIACCIQTSLNEITREGKEIDARCGMKSDISPALSLCDIIPPKNKDGGAL
jgi:hypothetical protein